MDNIKHYDDFIIEKELKDSVSEHLEYFQDELNESFDFEDVDENFNDHIKATAAALYKVYKGAECWAKNVKSFVKDNKLSDKLADEIIKVLSSKDFFGAPADC